MCVCVCVISHFVCISVSNSYGRLSSLQSIGRFAVLSLSIRFCNCARPFTGSSRAPDALIFCRSKKLRISRKFGSILVIYNANYMPWYIKIMVIFVTLYVTMSFIVKYHNVHTCGRPHPLSEFCNPWLCNYSLNFVLATTGVYPSFRALTTCVRRGL